MRDPYSPTGLTVPLAAKDLRLALHEGELAQVPMPSPASCMTAWSPSGRGWSDPDWSALGKLAAADAGLSD